MTTVAAPPALAQFEITQKFFFDAAHTLQREIEAEGSRRIHGHTYHAEVTLAGTPHADTGMVVDLGRVRLAIAELRPQLDHQLLDEVPGLGPATLENLAAFVWRGMESRLPQVVQVRVWREALGDGCTLRRSPQP
ncbi:6-carboxytetrahydropterin synthase [Rhodoferax sp.]|jgi:6-pyruvoyltetrahydropterin/6-carboxytetrahydropterin synthase|uniref:6-carboxytetrahydropterin synthase n=1 Tax=Rhodoferax sp. TaxID=50421 RepID=UPI003784FCB5